MPVVRWDANPLILFTREQVERKLKKVGQLITDRVKKKLSGGRRRGGGIGMIGLPANEPPHVDTGALRQSIFWKIVKLPGNIMAVRIGTSKMYGLVLEKGATIRPRKAKMLAMPASPEAIRLGRMGTGPRAFPRKLRFVKTKRGGLLVEDKAGRGKKGTGAKSIVHYILFAKATIKKHPFLKPSLYESRGDVQTIFSSVKT